MKIARILNNNVVIVLDEKHNERVVCGKGIAFSKRIGDSVDESQINKIFVLQNQIMNKKFQAIVADIPLEHLQIASRIIEMIKLESGKKLNDSIYITLSDHIHTSIQRFLEGINIKSPMKWDIRRFYEQEYLLGIKALEIVNEHFKIQLPEDEAAFIALHIVNSEMDDSDIQQVTEITKIMQEISNIVKYYFSIEFDVNSVYYYRFITHLKFFAQRLLTKKTYDENTDDDLLMAVKKKYQTSYKCVEKISEFILRKYKYALSNEEKLYLTIHIERIIYRK